ncbi:cuticle protein 10.9-like [Frankliniella occidentalis]|uniref:Cuticle protein 10.9-like n=1 Tax=Frankliniella occidentalis TaxID=133901 RepID=A0A9C6TU60_FRAOC|nr:cuticle protein 10.9-like [Frankliniella occidentalis]
MKHFTAVLTLMGLAVSAAQLIVTEEAPQPPHPYSFSYAAGRAPGHVDRVHSETSDGSGVVKGQYSYVDPRFKVRTVDYVADAHGFHAQLSDPVRDTPTVAAAKQRHHDLFARIAADHARIAAERAQDALEDPNHLLVQNK